MKITRRVAVALMTMALIGGMLAASAPTATAGSKGCPDSPFSDDERRTLGLEGLCGTPIVFSDNRTGDLFLTDDEGSTPIRLTRTPARERNPAGLFPWVFYDATTNQGSDIYMMSLLDPGHARVRITGLQSQDWDPTAVLFDIETGPVDASEVGDRVMALGPGGFYPVLLGYATDRAIGNGPKCGIEIYAEIFTLTGPERVSPCNRSDKADPEWSAGSERLAYEAWPWSGGGSEIRGLTPEPGDDVLLAKGMYPTWSPFDEGKDAPEPSQPAGDENIFFTKKNGDMCSVWTDAVLDFCADITDPGQNLGEMEWEACGCELVGNIYTPKKSWIALVGKGVGPPLTSKKKFDVQSMDFVSESFG